MRNVESSQCNSTNIETINIQVSGNVIFQIYLNHHAITMCGYVFCLHVAELRNISQTSACVCACVRVYVEIELM